MKLRGMFSAILTVIVVGFGAEQGDDRCSARTSARAAVILLRTFLFLFNPHDRSKAVELAYEIGQSTNLHSQ
jgi:hypothetical protein